MNQINRLKSKITSKELILNGTLSKRYKQCGKESCRCYTEKKYWHGPYWIWTRKIERKTVTKTLSNKQALVVKKAIKEMRDLNVAVEKWRVQSSKKIDEL
jgi:hypothetical protein